MQEIVDQVLEVRRKQPSLPSPEPPRQLLPLPLLWMGPFCWGRGLPILELQADEFRGSG